MNFHRVITLRRTTAIRRLSAGNWSILAKIRRKETKGVSTVLKLIWLSGARQSSPRNQNESFFLGSKLLEAANDSRDCWTKIRLHCLKLNPHPRWMFDSQRNSRCITFWHSSTRNPLDARSRVGATFVILSDTSPIQNLLRTYPRYDLFDSFVPFPWLTFQDFRFVMESKLHISKIVSWIEYKTFDEIRSILSNLDLQTESLSIA